jgi:FemAB-related protein (PEP-CTERM system-associated)
MKPADVEVRAGAPEHDEARDAFVLAHPRGSFFHLAGWRRTVERVFGNRPRDLLAWDGDELIGVLPLMHARGLAGSDSLISMPYGVYGGPLGVDPAVDQALLAEATRIADTERVAYLELRYAWDPGSDLVGSTLYHTFVRDLPEDPDDVLARMPKKSRAEARKARTRHGLELSHGPWYIDDLYRMFLHNKHALGSPALPRRMFATLMEEFDGRVHVHLVRRGSNPLAAVMSFVYRDTLLAYYSGTAAGADHDWSASNFMYMSLQEWAVREGFRVFDFGRSRADSGAYKFKLHQGFEPEPLEYRYHLVKKRRTPSFNPSNPKLHLLQSTWRRLPLWLARRMSNRLSAYLP